MLVECGVVVVMEKQMQTQEWFEGKNSPLQVLTARAQTLVWRAETIVLAETLGIGPMFELVMET